MSSNSISINNFKNKLGKLQDKDRGGRGILLSQGDLAALVINWVKK
jgi:hypothetical protein